MFRFPIMKPSFRFVNVKVTAVPATSFINDLKFVIKDVNIVHRGVR